MTDYVLRKPDTMATLIRDNEVAIYNDVDSNEGTLASDVATRLTLNQDLVDGVLEVLVQQGIVRRGQNVSGANAYFWIAADWANAIITNRAAVRTWIDNPVNDAKKISALAIDVGVHEAIATALARIVEREGGVELSNK